MTELQASRTLVKSPPELWAECSDAASLARHLDGFGEIRITRLEPETAVAWEGERARGTVRIEPAGWGTKVILTAVAEGAEREEVPPPAQPEAAVIEIPAEVAVPPEEPPPPARKRRFARLRAYWRGESLAAPVEGPPLPDAPPPATEASPATEAPPPATEASQPVVSDTEATLAAALDSLGQAHHRPYSRA
jgi:hypothetical protein